eukprot:TRINITY_DN4451_c0_g1_i3.p1 TRINITY_DN4451_c0_g1~~TRINITY_DN4451_c0_g1_i3.p1  ORF type:complete len:1890 (+),score=439.65 TRINITY_DN4451_c0_g1_i3:87-5756(+)
MGKKKGVKPKTKTPALSPTDGNVTAVPPRMQSHSDVVGYAEEEPTTPNTPSAKGDEHESENEREIIDEVNHEEKQDSVQVLHHPPTNAEDTQERNTNVIEELATIPVTETDLEVTNKQSVDEERLHSTIMYSTQTAYGLQESIENSSAIDASPLVSVPNRVESDVSSATQLFASTETALQQDFTSNFVEQTVPVFTDEAPSFTSPKLATTNDFVPANLFGDASEDSQTTDPFSFSNAVVSNVLEPSFPVRTSTPPNPSTPIKSVESRSNAQYSSPLRNSPLRESITSPPFSPSRTVTPVVLNTFIPFADDSTSTEDIFSLSSNTAPAYPSPSTITNTLSTPTSRPVTLAVISEAPVSILFSPGESDASSPFSKPVAKSVTPTVANEISFGNSHDDDFFSRFSSQPDTTTSSIPHLMPKASFVPAPARVVEVSEAIPFFADAPDSDDFSVFSPPSTIAPPPISKPAFYSPPPVPQELPKGVAGGNPVKKVTVVETDAIPFDFGDSSNTDPFFSVSNDQEFNLQVQPTSMTNTKLPPTYFTSIPQQEQQNPFAAPPTYFKPNPQQEQEQQNEFAAPPAYFTPTPQPAQEKQNQFAPPPPVYFNPTPQQAQEKEQNQFAPPPPAYFKPIPQPEQSQYAPPPAYFTPTPQQEQSQFAPPPAYFTPTPQQAQEKEQNQFAPPPPAYFKPIPQPEQSQYAPPPAYFTPTPQPAQEQQNQFAPPPPTYFSPNVAAVPTEANFGHYEETQVKDISSTSTSKPHHVGKPDNVAPVAVEYINFEGFDSAESDPFASLSSGNEFMIGSAFPQNQSTPLSNGYIETNLSQPPFASSTQEYAASEWHMGSYSNTTAPSTFDFGNPLEYGTHYTNQPPSAFDHINHDSNSFAVIPDAMDESDFSQANVMFSDFSGASDSGFNVPDIPATSYAATNTFHHQAPTPISSKIPPQAPMAYTIFQPTSTVATNPRSVPSDTYYDPTPVDHSNLRNDWRDPHPVVCFGFGGRIISITPSRIINPLNGEVHRQPGLALIHQTKSILTNDKETQAIVKLPGPLAKESKESIERLVKSKLEEADRCENYLTADSQKLIWEFMHALFTSGNGKLLDTKTSAATLTKLQDLLHENIAGESWTDSVQPIFSSNYMESSLPKQEMERVVSKMQELLSSGKKTEAHTIAMEAGLWSHAILLSGYISAELHSSTLQKFAQSLFVPGTPLRTLYKYWSNNLTFEDERESQLNSFNRWKENLRILISNPLPSLPKALLDFGDRLREFFPHHGPAQICYLLADVPPAPLDALDARIILYGMNPNCPVRMTNYLDGFHLSELYEAAKVKSNSEFMLPSFQHAKLLHAARLCELGMLPESLRYIDTITSVVKSTSRSSRYSIPFLASLDDFAKRIKAIAPARTDGLQNLLTRVGSFLDIGITKLLGTPEVPTNSLGPVSNVPVTNPTTSNSVMLPGLTNVPLNAPIATTRTESSAFGFLSPRGENPAARLVAMTSNTTPIPSMPSNAISGTVQSSIPMYVPPITTATQPITAPIASNPPLFMNPTQARTDFSTIVQTKSTPFVNPVVDQAAPTSMPIATVPSDLSSTPAPVIANDSAPPPKPLFFNPSALGKQKSTAPPAATPHYFLPSSPKQEPFAPTDTSTNTQTMPTHAPSTSPHISASRSLPSTYPNEAQHGSLGMVPAPSMDQSSFSSDPVKRTSDIAQSPAKAEPVANGEGKQADSSSAAEKKGEVADGNQGSSFGFGWLRKILPIGGKQADLGDSNSFYYNAELGGWVERGKEHEYASSIAPPPPPTDFGSPLMASAPASSRQAAPIPTQSPPTQPMTLQPASSTESAPPMMPLVASGPASSSSSSSAPVPFMPGPMGNVASDPQAAATQNRYSAFSQKNRGARARYVDTLNPGS